MKDMLGDAPSTLGAARGLGATRLLVICPPPCRHQARIEIAALNLPDETPFAEIATKKRLICTSCDRPAAPGSISIDWGVTASKAGDGR